MSRRLPVLLCAALFLLAAAPPPAAAQSEPERLRVAKALFFDRKYVEAREAWRVVLDEGGPEASAAGYWVARCSESLGEHERALGEYAAFLARRPADRTLVEEARTSRIGLAARLYKAGRPQHLPVLKEALADPSKTVRYYAALQLAGLGPSVGRPALPVLKSILADESDDELVDRARLAILKVDPSVLKAASPTPRAEGRQASWVRLRIFEAGKAEPKVSVNVPVALAELVFKSLPDDAKSELRKKGYDADNFWERLKALGPTDIVEIVGEDGERIKIWIE
jgi:hypothetical protein